MLVSSAFIPQPSTFLTLVVRRRPNIQANVKFKHRRSDLRRNFLLLPSSLLDELLRLGWPATRDRLEFLPSHFVISDEEMLDLAHQHRIDIRDRFDAAMYVRLRRHRDQAIVAFRLTILGLLGLDHAQ